MKSNATVLVSAFDYIYPTLPASHAGLLAVTSVLGLKNVGLKGYGRFIQEAVVKNV